MQQALLQMPLQLSPALSAVTGTTGRRILRAIGAGECAPHTLAALRHSRGKKEAEEIALALTGTWREAPLFVLRQALALCEVYTAQLSAGDAQLARAFAVIKPRFEPVLAAPMPAGPATPPRCKPHSPSKNAPEGNTRAHILRRTGGDLVAVHGLSDALAQTSLAELGTDMHKGPDDKHVCSWPGLAPKNDRSGGQGLKSHTMNIVTVPRKLSCVSRCERRLSEPCQRRCPSR
jgi:hypothetical protein